MNAIPSTNGRKKMKSILFKRKIQAIAVKAMQYDKICLFVNPITLFTEIYFFHFRPVCSQNKQYNT